MDRSCAATPAPEDPTDAQDPLSAVSMRHLVHQGVTAIAAVDPGFLSEAATQLGPGRELQALQDLLKQ